MTDDSALETNGLAVIFSTDALIKRAVAAHDAASARRFILSMPDVKREGATLAVVGHNYPEVVQLATLEHLAGDRAVGDSLARGILEFLDRGGTFGLAGADDWARATADALLGHDRAALSSIERLEQASRLGWWARIEGNAAFHELRATAGFRAIEADDRIWLEGQQRALGQMRLKGEVPIRSGGARRRPPVAERIRARHSHPEPDRWYPIALERLPPCYQYRVDAEAGLPGVHGRELRNADGRHGACHRL